MSNEQKPNVSAPSDKRRDPIVMDSGTSTNARIVRIDDGTEHGQLVITVDLNRSLRPATSGKNILTATVGANLDLSGVGTLGLNLYRKPKTDAEVTACLSAAAKVEAEKALQDEFKTRLAALKAKTA
jgi:hypothetical protein